MKKLSIAIFIVLVFSVIYVLSHTFKDIWWLIILPFLALPFTINVFLFERKKLPISFVISGLLIFAFLFVIGMDDYYTIMGLEINLNGYLGLYYGVLAIILIIIGIILSLTKLLRTRKDKVISPQ